MLELLRSTSDRRAMNTTHFIFNQMFHMLLAQEAMRLCDRMKGEICWKVISQHGRGDKDIAVKETKRSCRTSVVCETSKH